MRRPRTSRVAGEEVSAMPFAFSLSRAARWTPVAMTELDAQPRTHRRGRVAPRGAASVAPPGRFANPFEPAGADGDARLGGLVEFAVWLAHRRDLLAEVHGLAGRDLACTCALDDPGCHRSVLLDVANPPEAPLIADGRAMGLTVRRPWASLLLVPEQLGGKTIENRTRASDYRGPVLVYGGTQIDTAGISAAQRAGLDAAWHTRQQGWLGAVVLVDVHPADHRCCRPWGHPPADRDNRLYHWVFRHPHRLAARTWGCGFVGLRPTSWSVLVPRGLLAAPRSGEGSAQ
jgi:Domain of unknown function (DUF4326)